MDIYVQEYYTTYDKHKNVEILYKSKNNRLAK